MARVAVVTTSYPAHLGDAAGHFVAAQVAQLAEANDVHVIAAGDGDDSPHATVHWCGGRDLFRWPGVMARWSERSLRGRHVPSVLWRMRRKLDALQPDRLICHWLVPCVWPLLLGWPQRLGWRSGLREPANAVETHLHGADVRLLLAMPQSLRKSIVSWGLERSQLTFASHAIRDALCSGLDASVAHRLRRHSRVELPLIDLPPIDDVQRREQRRKLGLCEDERIAVFAGRLITPKRPDLALHAAQARGMTLVVVGEGPLSGPLRDQAKRLATRVVFTGQLARPAALATIAAADLVLHPSCTESAPSVVREARALGVPVLASRAGDVARWARRDAGIELTNDWAVPHEP